MSEEWRRIWGVTGEYQISTHGRVRNDVFRILKPQMQGRTLEIRVNGKSFSLPRLVLTTFRSIRHAEMYFAAYKDGDPTNVHLSNLEWRYKGSYFSRLKDDDVRSIRRLWEKNGDSYRQIGARYGVSAESVGLIIRGDAWGHVE